MQCLILAGGLGTRIRSIDPTVPKTLLEVAGRPFADWQLQWLVSEGVDSVVYSIGHMGHLIRAFVGNGAKWGIRVNFVEETEGLLGTGGAVRLALDRGALDERFLVLYGDSYLQVALRLVDLTFQELGLPALMTVFRNDGRWDASNATFDGRLVTQYRKGSNGHGPMHHIDYGLLELSRSIVGERIPADEVYDLAQLLESLSEDSLLGGYEASERFYEIGSPGGMSELRAHLTNDAS